MLSFSMKGQWSMVNILHGMVKDFPILLICIGIWVALSVMFGMLQLVTQV